MVQKLYRPDNHIVYYHRAEMLCRMPSPENTILYEIQTSWVNYP